jgi:hypothetical protein
MYRRCAWLVLLSMPMCLLGCSGPAVKQVPLVRVRGVVTLDGQPLAKAVVTFEAADGSFSYGQTDRRGRYDLRFDSARRGVTPGAKTVRISMNRRLLGVNSHDEGGPHDRAGGAFPKQAPEIVPERYNIRSGLNVEVTPDTTRHDFALKS